MSHDALEYLFKFLDDKNKGSETLDIDKLREVLEDMEQKEVNVPNKTLRFLSDLKSEDIATLKEIIKNYHNFIMVVRITKYFFVGCVTLIFTFFSIGEGFQKFWEWFSKLHT